MNNEQQNNDNSRGRPFPPSFNIGTTIQSVFRNINHAFASHHNNGGQGDISRDPMGGTPHLEPLNSVGAGHVHPTDATPTTPTAPDPSISSASIPVDADLPLHSQLDSQRSDDEDSMPDLGSMSDSSGESDAGAPSSEPVLSSQDTHPVSQHQNNHRTDDEGASQFAEPAIGTRRARVDDDGDDDRDRRHPSERVGGAPPVDAAPQNADPLQPPRIPAGLFGALFGLGSQGGNHPEGDAPPEHPRTHTGEGTADPSSAGNDPNPGHAPRGVPILAAGFTLTIPVFGSPPGNRTVPASGGQGATGEELLASFTAFFQEFQALEEGREDPERAKKLVAGLEVVPLGLVKRLERVGGAPGGHAGDSNGEGTSSGCAVCWDTLLDAEGDSFSGLLGGEVPQPANQNETRTEGNAMDIDGSASHSNTEASSSTMPSSEAVKIISLPCAHVFHASCLLPWFTRARQATCPTCRFNIDPENLTYTPPPRRPFNRAPPAQSGNAAPSTPRADLPGVPHVALAADVPAPQVDPARTAPDTAPPGPESPPLIEQAGVPTPDPGPNPLFAMPGIPVFSFPSIQIPLRTPGGQAPGDGNQGIDVLTIGLDMFVGTPPSQEERRSEAHNNTEGNDGVENGAGIGTAGGNGAANPNGIAQDLQSLIEGLLRTTQNIIPQVVNGQGLGPAPAPAPGAPPVDGGQPQPQGPLAPEEGGHQPGPPGGGPRVFPIPLRPNMFRPTRPMPPRRERKAWTLPPAPGPSLRQRVEQREREQGLRCCDTSCGVGPSDDDPNPELVVSSVKQAHIRPLPIPDGPEISSGASVCAHEFHPECLVSAERVAGWGGEDKGGPFIEVSCPVCRAVGCVTRGEWESGVSAL